MITLLHKIKNFLKNLVIIFKHKKDLKKINKHKNEIVNVVFICQVPSLWNSLKSVYNAALENSKIKAYLIAIPEKKSAVESKNEEYEKNNSYELLKKNGYDVIDGYKNNTFFDLKTINPDYVFLPRPYDDHLPAIYQSNYLSTFTRVCYITYGYSITKECMPTVYKYDFLRNTYLFYPDSLSAKNYVSKNLKKHLCNWNKIGLIGYPRFDLLKISDNSETKCKSFLWTPRWTTKQEICGTNFFNYLDKILEFFISHSELTLIFRPHPLLFKNFLSTGQLTQEKYDQILTTFSSYPNLIFDDPINDYIDTFNKVDTLITDPTSLLTEFYYTSKPIIYCTPCDNFNDSAKILEKGLYISLDWKTVENNILMLAKGLDELKEYRKNSIKDLNDFDNIGKSITDSLIEDYFSGK